MAKKKSSGKTRAESFSKENKEKLEFLYKAGKHISDLSEIFTLNPHEIVQKIEQLGMEFVCEANGCYNVSKFTELTWIEEKDLYYCKDCMQTHFAKKIKSLPPKEPDPDNSELRKTREAELKAVNKDFIVGVDLGNLSDEAYQKVYSNAVNAKRRATHAMFNQEFEALLKSVTTKTIVKNCDGQKMKEAVYKIIIETNEIDYESLEKEAPYIHGIITYNEIMQFKSVNFGELLIRDLSMSLRGIDENGDVINSAVDIRPAKIINLTVVNKINIPHYFFSIEIPKTIPGRYLLDNLKGIVRVSINKPAGLFDDIPDVKVTIKGVDGEQEK